MLLRHHRLVTSATASDLASVLAVACPSTVRACTLANYRRRAPLIYQPRRSFAYQPDLSPSDAASKKPRTPAVIKPVSTSVTATVNEPETLARASTSISDVLDRHQSDGKTFTCFASQSLYEAVQIMVSSRVGCIVAMEEDGEHVAGLVTERDILSAMVEIAKGDSGSDWRSATVAQAMTSAREMVHIKPQDRVADALALMTSQGFRHLPVLDSRAGSNTLRGIVSMRNLVDMIYKSEAAGGKAQFLTDILPRTGVPKNTSLRRKPTAATCANYRSLFLNFGVASLPHPDKKHGEDSFVAFVGTTRSEQGSADPVSKDGKSNALASAQPISVIAVFDGVGSWSFEQGIDPAKFSNECARALNRYVHEHPSLASSTSDRHVAPLSPQAMLEAAWQSVTSEKIVGSSTACVLSLAHDTNEVRAANIGDSGFLILRHRDALAARFGSVGSLPRASNDDPAYQVYFRSPQQLHYFNCPLQLGINAAGETDKFESPVDADVLTTPVQEGDLIVLATDGLFDNVPEETILATVSTEMAKLPTTRATEFRPQTIVSTEVDHPQTGSPLQAAADALAKVAYDLSIDKMHDSPFAVLAKENNILWKNGGRKDDITVIVARVDALPTRTA